MGKVDSSRKPAFDPASPGYDTDFCAWSAEQGRRLRLLRIPGLDSENLAEEIESLGRSDRRELASRIAILLTHLLKWQAQPELAGRSWRSTLVVQRKHMEALLHDSPSLQPRVAGLIGEEYPAAVAQAMLETGLLADGFPAACPWTEAELLDPGFLPQPP